MRGRHEHGDLLLAAVVKLTEATALLNEIIRRRDEAKPDVIEVPRDESFLDCKIDEVEFGVTCTTRFRNMIHNHNMDIECGRSLHVGCNITKGNGFAGKIETVRDLVAISERDLLRSWNMGRLTVNRIKAVLAQHGLKLAGDVDAQYHRDEEVV